MKKTEIKDWHTKTLTELEEKLVVLGKDLLSARTEQLTLAVKNVRTVRNIRRDIARLKTILSEKKTVEVKEKGEK